MKKLNKKGFLLIETLVVTVFVVSMFIFLYSNTLPLIGKYEQRFKYDDLDSVYAADIIRNLILDFPNADTRIFNKVKADGTGVHYAKLECSDFTGQFVVLCNQLKSELSIDSIYLTHYNLNSIKNEYNPFSNQDNRGLKAYVDYLPVFPSNPLVISQHRIIIVRKVEEFGHVYTRYANIEVMH